MTVECISSYKLVNTKNVNLRDSRVIIDKSIKKYHILFEINFSNSILYLSDF